MSSILKALRRLEEEKHVAQEQTLREEVVAAVPGRPNERPARRRTLWIAAGAAGLLLTSAAGLLLTGAIWSLLAPDRGPGAPPPVAAASADRPVSREPRIERQPTAPEDRIAHRVVAPSGAAAAAPAEPIARSVQVEPRPSVAALQAAADRVEPRSEPVAPPDPDPDPIVIVRNPVPPLVVERTVWHPEAGRRRAFVGLEDRTEPLEVGEGDSVGSLVVIAIEPSAVVFRQGSIELRYRVGAKR